jgi:hypothetical protein
MRHVHYQSQLWIIAVSVVAMVSSPSFAEAGTVDVVVDPTTLTLESASDGTSTAKVTLTNISEAAVVVAATRPGDTGCKIITDPPSVGSGHRTEVTLKLDAACDAKSSASVTLAFDSVGASVNPPSETLKVEPTEPSTFNWPLLGWSFLGALGVAVLLLAVIVVHMATHNKTAGVPGKRGSWLWSWLSEHQPATPGVVLVTATGSLEARDTREKSPIDLRTELRSKMTDWDFKDNWVNTLTLGAAALIALFTSASFVGAVAGTAEPFSKEKPPAEFLVAAAFAAVLAGLSPLLVKGIGKKLNRPTVGGTLAAAAVTIVALFGEICAVAWRGSELINVKSWAWWLIPIIAGLGGVVVFWYAYTVLKKYILEAHDPAPSEPSDAEKAAQIVALAASRETDVVITMPGRPKGGAFRLAVDDEATGEIAHNASAATIQGELQKLHGIPQDTVCTGGPLPTSVIVTFRGTLGYQVIPRLSVLSGTLEFAAEPAQPTVPEEGFAVEGNTLL